MLNAIGESVMQHTVRADYENETHDQAIAVKKNHRVRENRPVEKTEDSSKSEMNLKEEDTHRKNSFEEDGAIVVEEYNEDGVIVRKIPPGYVLQNEMA